MNKLKKANDMIKDKALYVAVLLFLGVKSVQAQLLVHDPVADTITFDPSDLVTQIIAAIVAIFTGMLVIYTVAVGIRWFMRLTGARK